MEFGKFTIFQFNGKDLFAKNAAGEFTVFTFCEIPSDLHKYLKPGKRLEIVREAAPDAGTYKVKDINFIGFHLSASEEDPGSSGVIREFVLESKESRKMFLEYQIRPATVVQHLKLDQEVSIDNAGLFRIPELVVKLQGSENRRAQILKSIADLEAKKDALPLYARNKLKILRVELESYKFNEPRGGFLVWTHYDE
jgi:hypothetical protein